MILKRIMLEDLIASNYKEYSKFKEDFSKKYYEESVAFLKNILSIEGFDVIHDYKQAEKEGVSLYNKVEVRTQLLKDNLITDGNLESSSIIYSDVNLESIAETLQEVTIEDLERQLDYYGTWEVHLQDEMYYLVNMAA